MADETFPNVFQEGRIGPMRTKNRLVMSSMCDNMADRRGLVTDQKVEYFRRNAQGGIGWINLGYAYVTSRGRGCTYFQVGIYEDRLIPGLKRLTDAVHEHDVRMGCQLAHAGRQTTQHYIDGQQAEAPSPVAEPLLGETPGELSVERIHEIVQEFADAAVRAREAGFDLVEFHGAHGYLHHAFVSKVSNLREDDYGGSLENRLRFSRECVNAVRRAVGDDFVVGYRLSASEFLDNGITLEDSLATVKLLEEEGADYVHVSGGSYETVHRAVAPMDVPPGHLEEHARAIKEATELPVLSVGRYNHPALADQVIANGSADFVVMGRALLADPDLPKKAQEGRADEIRPCVACEQGCIDRWFSALDITCVGNPDTGREALTGWGQVNGTAEPGRLLVLGGGPAGLEAARVGADAGHDVTLWESRQELGGQLALAARIPGESTWASLLEWLVNRCEDGGVRVETGKTATVDEVLDFGADAVVLATGARPWIERHLPGWDAPLVADPFEVLRGDADTGEQVVIFGGQTIGCKTALYLAEQGKQVTLVACGGADLFAEESAELANDIVGGIVRPRLLARLEEAVELVARRGVKRIEEGGVVIDSGGAFAPHLDSLRIGTVDEERLEADTVILGVRRRPSDELFEGLVASGTVVLPVGDANEPRTVYEAVAEGSAAGRSVGGERIFPSMPALAVTA